MKLFQVWINGILGDNLILAESKEQVKNALIAKGYRSPITVSEVTPSTIENFPTVAEYFIV